MRNQMTVAEGSGRELYRAEGRLDGSTVALSAMDHGSPRASLHWGPVSLFLSVEAVQVLGEQLLLAAQALRQQPRTGRPGGGVQRTTEPAPGGAGAADGVSLMAPRAT